MNDFNVAVLAYCIRCTDEAENCTACGKLICTNCDTTYGDFDGRLCKECMAEMESIEDLTETQGEDEG